jgi:hypothetical protein
MGFVPIGVREYAKLHAKANPDENAAELLARLRSLRFGRPVGRALPMRSPHLCDRVRVRGRVFHLHYRRGISQRRLRD